MSDELELAPDDQKVVGNELAQVMFLLGQAMGAARTLERRVAELERLVKELKFSSHGHIFPAP